VRNAVEKGPDVEVDHPVLLVAALLRHSHGVEGRAPGTIAIAVRVEDRLKLLLQQPGGCGLGDSVGHVRHTEHPHPCPVIFRYLDRPHRLGEVAPRTHPVPELVEVRPLLALELFDADGVHAGSAGVVTDLLPRLVDEALWYLKRLHLPLWSIHQLIPRRVDIWTTWLARPLRSSPITGPSSLLRAGPPLCLASVLCPLRFLPLGVLPSGDQAAATGPQHRGDRFSPSLPAPATSSRHLYTGHHRGDIQAAPRLRARTRRHGPLSRGQVPPRFRRHS
jgi:hypothetical protein